MRRLSMFSDALCKFCGEPAAEGLADGEGLWCEPHGRVRAVMACERSLFELLRTYPDELAATFEAVRDYRGNPETSHSTVVARRIVPPPPGAPLMGLRSREAEGSA